ncbi:MAG TPA: HAD family hydrolase [Terriglobales bacterium]|nr:HAD family hydrolase [Terriglobales bacterium]
MPSKRFWRVAGVRRPRAKVAPPGAGPGRGGPRPCASSVRRAGGEAGRPRVLIFDADDTLWENNVYFEQAIEHFYDLLGPAARDRGAARTCINRQEHRAIAEGGYGLASFQVALERAWQELAPATWSPAAIASITGLAATIAARPIEFLPGALDVLEYLAPRHRLFLLTKGNHAEQSGKIARSGARRLFERVHVVPEKHVGIYQQRLSDCAAPPDECWMIGNSPKSDINPALAAGMNAVFIPHPHTWVLEHEELTYACAPGRQCLVLDRLADLRDHF